MNTDIVLGFVSIGVFLTTSIVLFSTGNIPGGGGYLIVTMYAWFFLMQLNDNQELVKRLKRKKKHDD